MTAEQQILEAIPHAAPEVVPILLTEYDRQVLRNEILTCTRCPLHLVTTPVPWSGDRADLTIIGDAPGEQEEKMGEPFVGRLGNKLNEMLRYAGLARRNVATVNTICCRPPENDFDLAVSAGAPEACEPNLIAQLDFTNSWLIVAMGEHALSRFKPEHQGIARERGKPFWWQARLVVPTFHPSDVLHNAGLESSVVADLKMAKRYLDGAEPLRCDQLDPSIIRGVRAPTDDKIIDHFNRYGWAIMFSPFLNSRVAVERPGVSAPDGWDHHYSFTPEFIAKMRGATPSMWSATAALFRELGATPL